MAEQLPRTESPTQSEARPIPGATAPCVESIFRWYDCDDVGFDPGDPDEPDWPHEQVPVPHSEGRTDAND